MEYFKYILKSPLLVLYHLFFLTIGIVATVIISVNHESTMQMIAIIAAAALIVFVALYQPYKEYKNK